MPSGDGRCPLFGLAGLLNEARPIEDGAGRRVRSVGCGPETKQAFRSALSASSCSAPRLLRAFRTRLCPHDVARHCRTATWRDPKAPAGQRILTLGIPPKTIVDADGVHLVKYQ